MDLQEELLKLTELAPDPPDLSFLLGYLAAPLPRREALGLRPALQQLMAFLRDALLSPLNALQLVAVLKLRVLPAAKPGEEGGRLATEMQTLAGQLICDKEYLTRRYFEERVPQGAAEESMGVECAICTLEITAMEMCYLSCGHMYHRGCLEGHSQQQVSRKALPLRCPAEECRVQLLVEEVGEYLSRQLREKHDEFTFQSWVESNAKDTSWCPTPGCQAVFCFDAALENYRCPSCKRHYCLRCKCDMHAELSCAEYRKVAQLDEPDRKFIMLVRGSKFKQCPNCRFWVEKNEGCDHMTCRCKYEFCYLCGGKYGACRCNGQGGQQPLDDIFIELPPPPAEPIPDPPLPPPLPPLLPPSPLLAYPGQFKVEEGELLPQIMVDNVKEQPMAEKKLQERREEKEEEKEEEKMQMPLDKREQLQAMRQRQDVQVQVELMPIRNSERKGPIIGYSHNKIPPKQPLVQPPNPKGSRWEDLREKIQNTRIKFSFGKAEKREE